LSHEESQGLSEGQNGRYRIRFSQDRNLKGKMCKFTGKSLWYIDDSTDEEEKMFSDFIMDCLTDHKGWFGYLDW
jgi:hypothetical protein